ncbi:hypothetical protein HFD91_07640 [Enterobacteriaceae bacterium EKM102V]|uniref:hypothetical protein n=1 Tax=Pantoea TaxID=53335 RepID=UPI00142E1C9C|nr:MULTISPECIES: hypothetical protein [Pantoea]KAF6661253.1 hypothetical protein HFD91_07640 [Enterobacteriaceae bacterium EKM102V]KAF6668237.1 hypothetical protein HFD97_09415 [Pantoea sp. EKM103V]
MRLFAILMALFFINWVAASECYPSFNEKDFIAAIGKKPEKVQVFRDGGRLRHQYSFRKEQSLEDAFDESKNAEYEPQIYVTLYNPPCPERISIHFYSNEDDSMNQVNVALAGKAFEYLTGTNSTIFENKLEKFKDVQRFESYDEKANSLFVKTGDSYSIQIHLK